MLGLLSALWLTLWLATPAGGGTPADGRLAVALKSPEVASGDTVTLSLVAVGISGEPDLKPLLEDFQILNQTVRADTGADPVAGPGVGAGQARREWVISLRPRRDGRLRIPPLTLAGLRTDPQWVQVKASSASRPEAEAAMDDGRVPPRDVVLEVSADTDTPYLQAVLRYRVRVLARVPLRDATLSKPVAADALIRPFGEDRRFDVEQDGGRYRVSERLYLIVAQRAGPLTIEGPTLSAAVPLRALDTRQSPDALLEHRAVISRKAADLTVDVRPPPTRAEMPWLPAESVSIAEHWRPTGGRVRVGQPIERRIVLEVSGVGADVVALPSPAPVEGLRVYPQPAETSRREVGEDLLLTTTLRQTLVPTVPGLLRLPPVRLPWWSVGMDEPREASLPARELVVDGAVDGAAGTGRAAKASSQERFLARAADDWWGAAWLAPLLALAWLATLFLWVRERGRRRRAELGRSGGPRTAPVPAAADWVKRFERACEGADAKGARDALAGWASSRSGDGGAAATPAANLVACGAGEAELVLVRELDRYVYGPALSPSVPWRGATLLAAIGPLLQDAPAPTKPTETRLPPLFPGRQAGN